MSTSAREEAIMKKYGRKPKNAAACLLSRQEKRVMFDSADYAQTLQKSHHPPAPSGNLSQASTNVRAPATPEEHKAESPNPVEEHKPETATPAAEGEKPAEKPID